MKNTLAITAILIGLSLPASAQSSREVHCYSPTACSYETSDGHTMICDASGCADYTPQYRAWKPTRAACKELRAVHAATPYNDPIDVVGGKVFTVFPARDLACLKVGR